MKKIFVLIHVYRGFIQEPQIFYIREEADLKMGEIKENKFNPDYDEIDIFEKNIRQ